MAKYSVLTTEKKYVKKKELLDSLLYGGVKVLFFGCEKDTKTIERGRKVFIDAGLLKTFIVNNPPVMEIEDGLINKENQRQFKIICDKAPEFNEEQYVIEHADAGINIKVEAGAGTGKTTVMLDRIMFLVHTVDDLSFEDIGMITFTNEATQNMKHRLQDILAKRYDATKSPRYIKMLEEQSKLHIQTIHSFSNEIVSELGTLVGYGQDISIRSFVYERKQLVRDVLDELYGDSNDRVEEALGANIAELEELILYCWGVMDNLGLTNEEISTIDWGTEADNKSKTLQNTLKRIFEQLITRYVALKNTENSMAVGDIIRELQRIFTENPSPKIGEHRLKYLFVDEFQDSDNAQIRILSWLYQATGMKMFVVGDVKQSIYRFRGAVETAFQRLDDTFDNLEEKPHRFTLTKNYRTYENILDWISYVFKALDTKGVFIYGEGLLAQKKEIGKLNCHNVISNKKAIEQKTVTIMRDALEDCADYAKKTNNENAKEQKVTVLARTNYKLAQIEELCREENIPCYIKREGTFFTSKAVRDFFVLVKSFVFQYESRHLFDYLVSPYCDGTIRIELLQQARAGSLEQVEIIRNQLIDDDWHNYCKQLKSRPALAVLREITGEKCPECIFPEGSPERLQYSANLEKLFSILRKQFIGDMASLHDIYGYLKIRINTDKSEDEPDISDKTGCDVIYGMTVHKAKGLEFDTVILIDTDRFFLNSREKEFIIDDNTEPHKAGWKYENRRGIQKNNNYYETLIKKEHGDIRREEARLLYVALTRSIRRLDCIIVDGKKDCWSEMLGVN